MAVIRQDDYKTIATDMANGFDSQSLAKGDYFDAVYQIVLLQSIRPEVDLLNVYFSTYQVMTDILLSSSSLLGAVRALNNHVLNEGGYSNIDAYLDDTTGDLSGTTTIPQTWADLSDQAGFSISAGNIV